MDHWIDAWRYYCEVCDVAWIYECSLIDRETGADLFVRRFQVD